MSKEHILFMDENITAKKKAQQSDLKDPQTLGWSRLEPLSSGHMNPPSQKGHQQNCQGVFHLSSHDSLKIPCCFMDKKSFEKKDTALIMGT